MSNKLSKGDWKGRVDSTTDKTLFRWHQIVEEYNGESFPGGSDKNFAIVGYCSDEGVKRNQGRIGAAKGPIEVRRVLANLPAHFGENSRLFDAGNIAFDNNELEKSQDDLTKKLTELLKYGLSPILLGGGHEIAYPHYMAIEKSLASKARIGIINFDAHFDIRESTSPNSGTSFLQIANHCKSAGKDFSYLCLGIKQSSNSVGLFNKADELGIKYILQEEFLFNKADEIKQSIDDFIKNHDVIYLSVCMDVFSSAYAPGVSAVNSNGTTPEIFFYLFNSILKTNKVVSLDIAEYNPDYDIDMRTARLISEIIFKYVSE